MKQEMTRDQRSAIEAVMGDVAISAGAGSGKTTVLAHRFAHAMKPDAAQGWTPAEIDQILTITFTNKAAGEIAERVRRVVNGEISTDAGRRVGEAWISTIHTFCARLVRRHLLEAGVEPRFAQVDDVASVLLKAEAFEVAARGLYGQHAGSTRLLDASTLSVLRQDVIDVHDNVRAMGLDPRQIRVPDGIGEIDHLMLVVRQRADVLLCALGECRQTESIARKRAVLGEWYERLGACVLGDEASCDQLVALGSDYDIKNLSGEANIANTELRSALKVMASAAQAASQAELLEGYRALVVAFTEGYAQLKEERSALDFDDLQERAVELLSAHPKIAERYREHFRLLMIDEFQDTNELQLRVIEPLRSNDLCVVGDERQSIYGFRYADVAVFERVRERTAHKVELAQNFRSHAGILGFVNHAFSQPHLFGLGFMRLDAGRSDGWRVPLISEAPRVECVLLDAAADKKQVVVAEEARLVARRIGELVASGAGAGDIAILVRNATNVAHFAAALEEAGVPVLVNAGVALFDATEVLEMMALLRAIAVPADDEALATVLASRLVRLSDDALLSLRLDAGREALWGAVRAVGESEPGASGLSADDEVAVRVAYRAIDQLGARLGSSTLHETVHAACEAFDYDLTLLSQGPAGLRAWGNVLKIARYAEQFEQVESSDPAAFVEYLSQRRDNSKDKAAAAEAGGDAVRIMTIHSAKGLEFPVVFVADLGAAKSRTPGNVIVSKAAANGGVVPEVGLRLPGDEDGGGPATAIHHRLAAERVSQELEEQKRCLYVACTRAEELLVVSGTGRLHEPAAEGTSMIDWIRESLGDPGESGTVACGDSRVAVTIAEVSEEPQVSLAVPIPTDAPLFARTEEALAKEAAGPTPPRRVSYSSLHVHEQCPLSYRVRFELGLGEFRDPENLRASDLGSALHGVMQTAGPAGPAPGALDAAVSRNALGQVESDRLSAAVDAFFASPLASRLAAADRVEREAPIRVALGSTALVGSVDALAWQGDDALVVDYKTGREPLADSDPRTGGYELQARCYALAAFEAGATSVEAVFCFVEHEARELRFDFAVAEAPAIRADLEKRIGRIAEGSGTHLAAYEPDACGWCPALGGVCPVDPPANR